MVLKRPAGTELQGQDRGEFGIVIEKPCFSFVINGACLWKVTSAFRWGKTFYEDDEEN